LQASVRGGVAADAERMLLEWGARAGCGALRRFAGGSRRSRCSASLSLWYAHPVFGRIVAVGALAADRSSIRPLSNRHATAGRAREMLRRNSKCRPRWATCLADWGFRACTCRSAIR